MLSEKVKKICKVISFLVLFLTFLCLFGFAVKHVTLGGQRFGPLTKPLIAFSNFPHMILAVLNGLDQVGVHSSYIEKDINFKQVNNLDYDLFALNSYYNSKYKRWDIKLFNFKNDSIVHTWYLNNDNSNKRNSKINCTEVNHSILLSNRSLIAFCDATSNLYRLDENSNIIWHNTDKHFHHSLSLSFDGDIWVCSSDERNFIVNTKGFFDTNRRNSSFYKDDFITKISVKTGEILYDKSVSEILIENGFKNFVYGFTNLTFGSKGAGTDPIHLNDIEPVYYDGKYWKRGDLFLSLRHRSLVIHYRPSTNEIINLLYGPFLNQHDVDIFSENEISIFNNNTTFVGFNSDDEFDEYDKLIDKNIQDEFFYSEIIIYNFEDSTYRKHINHQFVNEKIYSHSEGLHEILSTGDVYVECENDGKVYIMNNDKLILRKQFSTSIDNMVHLPSWIRIYENVNF